MDRLMKIKLEKEKILDLIALLNTKNQTVYRKITENVYIEENIEDSIKYFRVLLKNCELKLVKERNKYGN